MSTAKTRAIRATNILEAAENALLNLGGITLDKHCEFYLLAEFDSFVPSTFETRCLYLCFCAQMVLTGDL